MSTKIASLYAEISADTTKLNAGLKQTQSALSGAQTDIMGFVKAAGMLTGVAVAAREVYQNTAGAFVNYASEVRNITLVSGESADATSRLIQVADDYKISSSDLTTAQRVLAKEGYSLNIETMAKLSDEYLKLNTGAERQAFLTENLGRSGAVFAEMMNQGSAAILAKANAVQAGLILDERALDNARQYEMAIDDLNDQIDALKITAGKEIIPWASNLVTTTNQLAQTTTGAHAFEKSLMMVANVMGEVTKAATGGKLSFEVDVNGLIAAVAQFRLLNIERKNAKNDASGFGTAGAFMYHQQAQTYWPKEYQEALESAQIAQDNLYAGLAQRYGAGSEAFPTPPDLTDYSDKFNTILSLSSDYSGIAGQIAEQELLIAEARRQGYSETGAKLSGLKDDLASLQEAQASVADAFVFDALRMAAAADGIITGDEMSNLMDWGVALGQVDKDAADAAKSTYELAQAVAALPDDQKKTLKFYVDLFGMKKGYMVWLASQEAFNQAGPGGGGPTGGEEGGDIYAQASGGPASGLFLTGDSPGGWTPYTEAVYAPGGAYVYNAQKTRELFGGAKLQRYALGNLPISDDIPYTSGVSGIHQGTPPVSGGVWVSNNPGSNAKSDYSYVTTATGLGGSMPSAEAVTALATAATESATTAIVAPITSAVAAIAISTQNSAAQTAALAVQLSNQSVQQIALLESINAQLANMPTDIRDGFQQVVQ